ncbi:MAG TPA: glycosyl hydrolase family 18 protein [Phototrophicaceae bacterium]|jgi:GH18 family chitinase|nr:glycosyl hydrolase family 18 protein [Phototrophicaceae bacterium]
MSPKSILKIFAALIAAALLFIVSVIPSQVSTAANFKIVGYLTSWSGTVAEMQLNKLTHVNYAFILPNADGSLKALDNPAKLSQLVSAAHAQGVKVLISVGGWNDGNDSAFETLAASATGRTNFTNSMIAMVNQYNLDGVDIDWEYPDPDNSQPDNPQPGSSAYNYYLMMSSLSDAMHSRGKLLTAAVVALGWAGKGVPTTVFAKVDFLNLMAYDGGNGETHSPYQYAVDSINFWRGRGLPADKTVLGVPFYGRPSWASYRTLIGAGCSPDSDTCNYQGSLVYYNGRPTIRNKTALAVQQGGGVMYWENSQDTTDGTSLVSAIYSQAHGGTNPPTSIPPTSVPPGGCSAAAWISTAVYVGTNEVSYNGHQWRAKWWTQGETPGVAQVWLDLGPCSGNPTVPPATNVPPTGVPPTTVPNPTSTQVPGGNAWQPNTYYAIGAIVTYGGHTYRCIQAHTSLVGWEPPIVPALFQLVS